MVIIVWEMNDVHSDIDSKNVKKGKRLFNSLSRIRRSVTAVRTLEKLFRATEAVREKKHLSKQRERLR